jgi:hypothetical protein
MGWLKKLKFWRRRTRRDAATQVTSVDLVDATLSYIDFFPFLQSRSDM